MSELTTIERLLLPLVRRFVSLWVRPVVLPNDVRERFAPGRPVVYVLEKRGVVDVAVLEYVCRDRGLPPPLAPLGSGALLPASVLFLERRRGLFGQRIDRRMPEGLRALTGIAAADIAFDADLVPVSLFWGRAPGRERSWLRLMVAEGWDIGGRFRKALSLLINGRNLLTLFGDAIALQPSLAETRGLPRGPRRLSRHLRVQLRNQRAATIGPDLSHRRTIVAQVLRAQAVRQAVREEMRAKGLERREALDLARSYGKEIAANYSHPFVAFMSGVLGRLWNRLYDGIELANFSSLESVEEGSEIIYVPCHRSHMDYLLLSYVVFHKGFAVPHIAAGNNLDLPVIGRFLRRGGAFFLRRSFAGNTLYAAVFTTYLGQMMARGHSIEYFIEGGRSRTGRLLHPRTGMLAMTVRSYLREPRRPSLVPGTWLRAGGRRPHIHRRAVRPPQGKGIGAVAAERNSGAARPLRQGIRELRRADVARCADPAACARLEPPAHRLGRPSALAHADDRRSGAPDHGADKRRRLRDPNQPRGARAARDAAAEHGRGGSRSSARALRIAASPGAVLAARLGHRRRRSLDAQVCRVDAGDPAPPARARRHHPDDRGELGSDELLPQQRAASDVDAVADRLRVPQ
jgi:1-acyl-sn-glycerol-3-phosphate acyltransferase